MTTSVAYLDGTEPAYAPSKLSKHIGYPVAVPQGADNAARLSVDRVNYWKLFNKLLDDNVNCKIVRILAAWYSTQTCSVKWVVH